jgi:hypothetical protein
LLLRQQRYAPGIALREPWRIVQPELRREAIKINCVE